MSLVTVVRILVPLYLTTGILLAASNEAAQIEGSVVSATGAPVEGVTVTVFGSKLPANPSGITDASGHYTVKSIPSGSYSIGVSKPDLGVAALYGTNKQLTVSPGVSDYRVDFTLPNPATISGRVLGASGAPLPNVSVSAWVQAIYWGGQELEYRGQVTTNSEGEFRLWGLPAGKYFIQARPVMTKPDIIPLQLPAKPAVPAYVPTFYPSNVDVSSATAIPLSSGQDLTGMDIQMQMPKTACVRARAVAPGSNASKLDVVLTAGGPFNMGILAQTSVTSGKRVEFCQLAVRRVQPVGDRDA